MFMPVCPETLIFLYNEDSIWKPKCGSACFSLNIRIEKNMWGKLCRRKWRTF
jgi:hypothetical protein